MHGDVRQDPYYWLKEREDQEVVDYLNAENDYTTAVLKPTEKFQEDLFQEIKSRIKEDDQSVPYLRDGYYYYTRFEQGKEYPIICRKKGSLEADEQVLLDVNELAKGHDYYKIGGMSLSPNDEWLAFGEDTVSRRIYTIRFKNLKTGEIIENKIENTTGGVAWANDSHTLFYTQKDETLRPHKIYKHKFGQAQEKDVLIFVEEDETFACAVFRSKSKQYIFIGSNATLTTEFRYISADAPDEDFVVFQERTRGIEYSVAHYKEHFYIITNHEAQNFRLMKTSLDETALEHWEEVIAHREDTLLEDLEIFANHLVVVERRNALTHIRIQRWDGSKDEYLPFDDPAYVAYLGTNLDYENEWLRFGYTSLTRPSSVYEYNMESGERRLLKQQEVVGGYDESAYTSERIFVEGHDGTAVPMSLVYKKDLKTDGGNPALLYGYGSYGISIDPTFSTTRLSMLDRGFVYAIAHIRGGEELGRAWYDNGKLLTKQNTFADFISCGEYLLQHKYTTKGHLYAMGGSAGGMLMGTVINQRPDLWNGVIAAVPFVDVVTTMLDDTIPLTTGEYDEWGNPNEMAYYQYMKSYSPYDNVSNQVYPNLLVTTGLHDSQVQYWEPAKWVARLREQSQNPNLVLLHTNMTTGHGGASGRFESLKETAMEFAFLFMLEGITA